MVEDLKGCPFCGAHMVWVDDEQPGWEHPNRSAEPLSTCWLADAWIRPGTGEGSVEEWNTRSPPQGAGGDVEKLKGEPARRAVFAVLADYGQHVRDADHLEVDPVADPYIERIIQALGTPSSEGDGEPEAAEPQWVQRLREEYRRLPKGEWYGQMDHYYVGLSPSPAPGEGKMALCATGDHAGALTHALAILLSHTPEILARFATPSKVSPAIGGDQGSVVGSADALCPLPRHEQPGTATPSDNVLRGRIEAWIALIERPSRDGDNSLYVDEQAAADHANDLRALLALSTGPCFGCGGSGQERSLGYGGDETVIPCSACGGGGGPVLAVRPEVRAFARLMEAQLRANDHKPGWKGENPWPLLARLREETDELAEEMQPGSRATADVWRLRLGAEAADVANFAMMIADVCGALGNATPEGVAIKPEADGEVRDGEAAERPNPTDSTLQGKAP